MKKLILITLLFVAGCAKVEEYEVLEQVHPHINATYKDLFDWYEEYEGRTYLMLMAEHWLEYRHNKVPELEVGNLNQDWRTDMEDLNILLENW